MSGNWVPLRDLLVEGPKNGIYKGPEYLGSGMLLIKMNQQFGSRFLSPSLPGLERIELTDSEKARFVLQAGDLLFSRTSVVAEGVGMCSIVGGLSEPMAFESNLIRVRVDRELSLPRYLFYFFQSTFGRQHIRSISGGAAIKTIKGSSLATLIVPNPPLEMQADIANLLSAYDDLIENNRRRIVLLEALARNLYQEWFVRLRFPGWETTKIVDGVPEGWESKKLNQIASYLNRGVAPTYDASGDIWVINQKCVRDNRVNLTLGQSQSKKVSEEKLIRHGDILVNSTGTGTLGRVAQVWSNPENTTVDSHVTIVRPSPDVQPLWLGFTLFPLQKLLEDMGEGATNQKELKRTRLGDIAILWPADGLRNEFEHCVAPMVKMIQILDDQNRALSRARDILLPRLMSGELEP